MESDSYPFFVPPPFPPFSSSSSCQDRLQEDYQPISDLELHFNTLFMLESEKGRGPGSLGGVPADPCFTLLDDCGTKPKWDNNITKAKSNFEANQYKYDYNQFDTNKEDAYKTKHKGFEDRNSSFNSRTESFCTSELSTCSYMTNENARASVSDYGSLKSSLESAEWKEPQNHFASSGQDCFNDLWLAEKCSKDDDLFFDSSNYTGRLTPDSISDEILNPSSAEKCSLPPMETAFSKRFGRFPERDASIPQNGVTCNNLDLYLTPGESKALCIDNLDGYCYPNNICSNTFSKTDCGSKDAEYFELFEKVTLEDKVDNFDFGLRVFENDGAAERKETNDLIEDLGSLNYYQEEDDDLAGFVEQCTQNEAPSYGGFSNMSPKEVHPAPSDEKDDRICFWRNCKLQFPNQTTLVEHIEKLHVNTYKGEEFSCLWSECARAARPFNARYKLLIHMRVHSGHKPNQCAFPGCGKAFSRLENLKIHRRSHTGERPYRCQAPRCCKAFSNSSDRAKHQRTHFNARPYACQIEGCSKRYTDPSSLRKHVKNHLDPNSRTSTKLHAENAAKAREELPFIVQGPRSSRAVAGALHQKITRGRISSKLACNARKHEDQRAAKRLSAIREERETSGAKRSRRETVTSRRGLIREDEARFEGVAGADDVVVLPQDDGFAFGGQVAVSSEWGERRQDGAAHQLKADLGLQDFDTYVQQQLNIGYYD